jgi:sugar lactone lactonase YvrE
MFASRFRRRRGAGIILCLATAVAATLASTASASAAQWTRVGSIASGSFASGAVAQAPNGDFWISDNSENDVHREGIDGSLKYTIGSFGLGPGQFNNPSGVAVGPDGTLFVVDRGGQRVERFADDGSLLGQFGSPGDGPAQLDGATGIAVAADGTVYVAAYGSGYVSKWTSTGAFLGTLGTHGEFGTPDVVGVDPDGNIWVSDAVNGRVSKVAPDGTLLLTLSESVAPFGFAFTSDSVIVTDIYSVAPKLRTYTLAGALIDTLSLSSGVPHGWAVVASDGRLYADEDYFGLAVYDPPGISDRQAASISLSPANAADTVGTSHTVTVTALDATAGPIGRTAVHFLVNNGDVDSGFCATTVGSGTCSFTYQGPSAARSDTITACAYLPGDSFNHLPSGPCSTATEQWVPAGQPATITSAAATSVGMRTPFDFHVTTSGSPTPSLSESGALPAGVTFVDNGDGTAELAGAAAAGTAGPYPFTVTASNGVGDPASQPFILTVSSAPSAPAIVTSASDTETFGVAFNYTVSTTGYPVPTLKKTGNLPAGVTFTDNGNGTATIAGTPAKAAIGVYPLTLTAKSTAGTYAQSFSLTVTKAPAIKNIPTTTAHVGTNATVAITATGFTTPSLSASGLPAGLALTDNSNGTATIAGTPLAGSGGTYSVTVTATNTLGSVSQTFTLKVNEAPAITSLTTATATVGAAFSFQVTATGFPAPKLAKTGVLPKGITFNAASGTFSGTPKANTAGSYTVTITAKNTTQTATQTFTITVH